MLDTRSESHAGTQGLFEREIRNANADDTAPDLAEPFPPLPANSQNPQDAQTEENRLRKAMNSVDLLQALDDLAADDPQPARGNLDEILLAELGSDADEDIPQAAAAIDRQLLLSRIVKARDAILAEEQQAAMAAQAIASRAPAMPPQEPVPAPAETFAPFHEPPAFDTDLAPEPRSAMREAITVRRLALAVSVTALCIAAGWTLRSGSLPGLPSLDVSANGQAQAAMASIATGPIATPDVKPALPAQPQPAADATQEATPPVTATPLAERMAEGEAAPALDDEAIKQRLIETHAQPQRQEIEAKAAPQILPVAAPVPEAQPAAPNQVASQVTSQVASAEPMTQTDMPPDIAPQLAQPEIAPQPDPMPVASTPQTRDPAAVETAMAASFGLDDLEPSQRAALKQKLVAGECPSSALAALLGRAPVVATRDLVNNLENGC